MDCGPVCRRSLAQEAGGGQEAEQPHHVRRKPGGVVSLRWTLLGGYVEVCC
ncbi:hypothetical protein ACFUIT_38660 [Streptomyces sp. NPDC057239]|uniref:hypothetical protein n=1 Tax=Streptomyces sp. NPDC057239 TaxID=3346061 RepID=UPI00363D3D7C